LRERGKDNERKTEALELFSFSVSALHLLNKKPKTVKTNGKETANIQVRGMSCEHCAKAVEKELDKIPGVMSVSVSVDEGTVSVDYDSAAQTSNRLRRINEAGYEVEAE
jgi:copper chaperone